MQRRCTGSSLGLGFASVRSDTAQQCGGCNTVQQPWQLQMHKDCSAKRCEDASKKDNFSLHKSDAPIPDAVDVRHECNTAAGRHATHSALCSTFDGHGSWFSAVAAVMLQQCGSTHHRGRAHVVHLTAPSELCARGNRRDARQTAGGGACLTSEVPLHMRSGCSHAAHVNNLMLGSAFAW
jgi:hypothetical protein